MRKLVALLAAFVLVVALGATILIGLVDFSDYRTLLTDRIGQATGRKLTIAGDFRPRIFSLSPALVASDVRLANASWGTRPEMAKLKRIEIVISLPALLFGELKIKELVLVEPDVLLETSKKNIGNWIFEEADAATAKTSDTAPGDDGWTPPTVHRVRIERAKVTYRDGETGRIRSFGIADMRLRSDDRESPMQADIEGGVDDAKLRIHAQLGSLAALLDRREAWPVDIDARVGDQQFAIKGSVEPFATPVSLRLAMTAPRLDLGEVFYRKDRKRGSRLFDKEPLALAAFRALDAVVTAQIGSLIGVTGLPLDGFEAKLVVRNGVAILDPVNAQIGEAPLEMDARLQTKANGADFESRLSLKQSELGVVVREMTGKATLTGPLDVAAELRGSGRSVAQIMASADGYLSLVSGKGNLHNGFFNFLSADVIKSVTPWAPRQAPTRIRCGVARFDFRTGMGRSKVVVLDTTRATVVGEGVINLRNERLDLLFEPTSKDLSVLSVAALVPVRVSGRITNPTAEPAAGAVVTSATKAIMGITVDTARWVGSQIGVTGGPRKAGNPCPRARAVARAAATPAKASGGKTPSGRKKKGGVFDTIKGLFD